MYKHNTNRQHAFYDGIKEELRLPNIWSHGTQPKELSNVIRML